MKAHYHITLGDCTVESMEKAASLIGAKCTTIDLQRDQHSQRDRMLTKYTRPSDLETMKKSVKILRDAGYKILRFKFENMYSTYEEFLLQEFTKINYGELHLKVLSDSPKIETNFFVMSSNVQDVDHRFYNGRIYCEEDKSKFKIAFQKLLDNDIIIQGEHLEVTVYDSNHEFDAWWA